jgi:hypothetical protein
VTVAAHLRRGLLAGVLAGLLAGLFGLLVAEPAIDRAIALEEEQHAAAGEPHAHETFTRDTQKVGLIVGTTVTGTAVGALFALAYAGLRRRIEGTRPWTLSLLLAAGGFLGVFALPFLRYPANPPGVGDPETIGTRTVLWLGSIVVGLASVSLAGILRRWLAQRGTGRPVQDLASAGVVVLGLGALFLLPSNTDPVETDASLLWTFRMLSVAAQAVLWGGLGAIFGLLAERVSPPSRGAPSSQPQGAQRAT